MLELPRARRIRVGALGELMLRPGVYVYAGSAFGPGGLAARLAHHLQLARAPHWHIDYLRRYATLREIRIVEGERREHAWAAALAALPAAAAPTARFGASDCTCRTHLLFFPRRPQLAAFGRRIAIRQVSVGPAASRAPYKTLRPSRRA